ncbi:hypothetical protein [Myxococcus stipitatus]|uniref:hypothetical protein n=1 Tax=Myxococcus stipitatus TaxID=83455 RepID=UPI0030D2B3B7
MKTLSAESKVRRIHRIFQRTGGNGAWTRPFDELPAMVQAQLLGQVALPEHELPALACVQTSARWILLTSERLVLRRESETLEVTWGDIEGVKLDAERANSLLALGPGGKMALSRLTLIRRGGEPVELALELGPAFFGFWNVLLSIAASGSPHRAP